MKKIISLIRLDDVFLRTEDRNKILKILELVRKDAQVYSDALIEKPNGLDIAREDTKGFLLSLLRTDNTKKPHKYISQISFQLAIKSTLQMYLHNRVFFRRGERFNIALVGGGLAFESKPLRDVIKGAYVTSIDNAEVLKNSIKLIPSKFRADSYVFSDATQSNGYGGMQYDMLCFFHPQVVSVSVDDVKHGTYRSIIDTFRRIFSESYSHVRESGVVLVTCFTKNEADVSKKLLIEAGFVIDQSHLPFQNPFNIPNPSGLYFQNLNPHLSEERFPSWHHFVIVATKPFEVSAKTKPVASSTQSNNCIPFFYVSLGVLFFSLLFGYLSNNSNTNDSPLGVLPNA